MHPPIRSIAAALLAAWLPLAAAAPPPVEQRELLSGVLWLQQAPEARYATLSIFRNATTMLEEAIAAPDSAAIEQRGSDVAKLPPAVIVDLDETMLDNSPYEAHLVREGVPFEEAGWARWIAQRRALPVPGALAFAQAVDKAGARIFYVSNRECFAGENPCQAKEHTMANMRALGFPRADDPGAFLFKGERPGWGTDKTSRRQVVGAAHRIVMLVGDDMRDFVSPPQAHALHARDRTLVALAEDEIGRRWFVIPNPMYGSWMERLGGLEGQYAALDSAALPAVERLALGTWNMEWLMTTGTHDALLARCTPGFPPSHVRAIPCNKDRPPLPRRVAADFDALADVARRLPADVVALQEVDGPEAAATVFREGWQLACFISRPNPQKVGFAVRTGIPYACNPELKELDIDGATRAGADITLYPGTPHAVRLLAVHLKSGCFAGSLAEAPAFPPCAGLRKQVPVLERWIDARAAENVRFAVLGDFNRRLELDAVMDAGNDEARPDAVFNALSDGRPKGAVLLRATAGQAHVRCSPLDRHAPAAIDNILVSRSLAALGRLTYARIPYDGATAARHKFPDHCPAVLTIQ
ncbi:HAD family acid phosphatase [Massilia sp. METH4]|uniref:HAD family acid phosphatase n=1 Tax=Massilia sp. METH4 TaxID=3123041 RepID=UPI0030CFA55F